MDIIVQVSGGLVPDVFRIGRGKLDAVVVMDFDVSDDNAPSIIKTKDSDGDNLTAYIRDYGFATLPKGCDVERLYKAWKKSL